MTQEKVEREAVMKYGACTNRMHKPMTRLCNEPVMLQVLTASNEEAGHLSYGVCSNTDHYDRHSDQHYRKNDEIKEKGSSVQLRIQLILRLERIKEIATKERGW